MYNSYIYIYIYMCVCVCVCVCVCTAIVGEQGVGNVLLVAESMFVLSGRCQC